MAKKTAAALKSEARSVKDSRELMVAALAHEIKNPLNSMKGAAQYLFDKYKSERDVKEFSGIIIKEIDRLERYLNEFMSFYRGMKLRLKRTNIVSFITGIVMLVKHTFPAGIHIKLPDDALPDVLIDPEQMRQVMMNLMSNAKDAVKNNDIPQVSIQIIKRSGNIEILLKDNGQGIKKKDFERVFEPFYTTKEEGLGIGLAISKTIVLKHGGDMKVKSVPGKYTVFSITIPINGTRQAKPGYSAKRRKKSV